jgi:hypothetical protein
MRAAIVVLALATLSACRAPAVGPPDGLPVSVVRVPARTVVSMEAATLDEASIEQFALAVEGAEIPPEGDLMARAGRILIPVAPGTEVGAPLRVETMPAMQVAAVVLRGPTLEAIDRRMDELYGWIEANGYRPAGTPIRVITDLPPTGWVVEVLVPVEGGD